MVKRRALLAALLVLSVLFTCAAVCDEDWDGMDRSGWGWDGSQGDDSGNIHVVETRAADESRESGRN
jgi:hypothetical protein